MVLAVLLLLAAYAAIATGIVWLVSYRPHYAPYWIAVGLGLSITLASRYRGAAGSLVRVVEAQRATAAEHGALLDAVAKLAALAGITEPHLYVAPTAAPNAFSVGLRQSASSVVVTEGLLRQLDDREVEAVLAHEIAHLVHRDAAVMTAVAVPRELGEAIITGPAETTIGLLWLVIWPIGILPFGVGSALTLTVSRYREYAADRGSALLTGAPEQLMSALEKVTANAVEIPHVDLRAANAFCIVSTEAQRFTLFADHPPLAKRLAALSRMARELGRPVGP
jgi:heat shock protein HtpX